MHNVFLSCINRLRRAPVAASIGAYALFVLVLIAGIAHGARMIVSRGTAPVEALLQLGESASSASRKPQPVETASAVLEGDSWLQSVKSNFRERDRSGGGSSNLGGAAPSPFGFSFGAPLTLPDSGNPWLAGQRGKTYRTVCVRLCDGYFYPVSFATTGDRFERDEETCARSCASPARLYVYANPGEEPENMVSVSGQPYSKLPTAFQFRTKFDAACKCAPNPWEPEAMDRHRRYAEDAARKKRERQAAAEPVAATGAVRGKASQATGSARSKRRAQVERPGLAPAAVAATVTLINGAQSPAMGGLPAPAGLGATPGPAAPPLAMSAVPAGETGSDAKKGPKRAASSARQLAQETAAASARPMRLGAAPGPAGVARAPARADWRDRAFTIR